MQNLDSAIYEPLNMEAASNIRRLRTAIRNSEVTFPAQVPVFERLHRTDIQWRLVVLYFVRGWSTVRIASRYGFTPNWVGQLIIQWTQRAVLLGYLARIPPKEVFRNGAA